MMTMSGGAGESDRIVEAARALGNAPVRLYEFVRNRVAYVPYVGLLKGAERTLIDRSGNDLDQANLLCRLLRAAGYTARLAQSTNSIVPLNGDDGYGAASWVGVTNTWPAVSNALSFGGIASSYDAGQQAFIMNRYWVELSTNGGWHSMDPAFKPSAIQGSVTVACDTNALLATAGGTGTVDYVVGLNYSNISAYLASQTMELVGSLRTNAPHAAGRDILPHREIVPETVDDLDGIDLRFTPGGTVATFDYPPDVTRRILTLRCMVDSQWGATNWLDEVAHKKLWVGIISNNPWFYPVVQFWMDDTLISTEPGSHWISSAEQLMIGVKHPYAVSSQTNTYTFQRVAGNAIAIPIGFGDEWQGGMQSVAMSDLERLSALGLATNDLRLISASLWALGTSYLQSMDLANRITSWCSGIDIVTHHALGAMAQESSYYLDLKSVMYSPKGVFHRGDGLQRAFVSSALEHFCIEQMGGITSAVSTIRVLGMANDRGKKNYMLTAMNTNVIPSLNYSQAMRDSFRSYVTQGHRVFAPEDGSLTNGQWAGYGFALCRWAVPYGVTMAIKGGYNGGFHAYYNRRVVVSELMAARFASLDLFAAANPPVSRDPVDLSTGSFLADNTDLSMDGPLPMEFSRHHRTDRRYRKGPIGYGGTHGWDIRAVVHSDASAPMGGRTAEDAAAMLVAARHMWAFASSETVRDQILNTQIARWMADRLVSNSVSVTLGHKSLMFVLQPDGSYSPPPGVTMSLTKSNGVFVLSERNGSVFTFDVSNRLARLDIPAGPGITFDYGAGTNLQTVSSGYGQTMTLSYSGGVVSEIEDNSGRSVLYQYDGAGNLTNAVDPEGLPWGMRYDGDRRIVSMTDPMGIVTISNVYNSLGQVVSQTSASGHTWNQYSLASVRGAEEDPNGNLVEYVYDDEGRTILHRTADGAVTRIAYDGQNHATNVITALGVTNATVYDEWHNVRMTIEAVGTAFARTNSFAYDDRHLLTYATNAMGNVTEYAFDDASRPTLVRDPTGVTLAMAYDSSSGLLQTRSLANGGNTLWTESYGYENGFPRTVSATDAGTVTTYYDAVGNLERVVDAAGRAVTNVYDRRRLVTTNATSAGRTIRTYWGNGLLKTVTDARGFSATNTWTAAYKPLSTFLPDGGSSLVEYDAADRPFRARDARGQWTTNLLDSVGRVTNSLAAYGSSSFFFDQAGRMTGTVNAVLARTGLVLDPLGRGVAVVDPLLKTSGALYDALDRLRQSTNAANRVRQFEYDDAGRPTATVRPSTAREETDLDGWGRSRVFRDADEHEVTFVRDAQSRVTSVTDGAGMETKFRYDPSGVVTARWDAVHGWTEYRYDSAGRLTSTVYSAGTDATFGYDVAGNVTTSCFGNVSQSFAYDMLNRLSVAIVRLGAVSWTNGWGRDLNGNVTAVTYPGGGSTVLGYDAENRLDALTNNLSGGGIFQFRYDAAGRLTGIKYPNGVDSTNVWDLADRLVEQRAGKGAMTNIVRRTIRDDLGLPIRDEIDAGLMPVPTPDTWRRSVHDQGNRVLSATGMEGGIPASWAYTYDGAGNLLVAERTTTAGVSNVRYAYDCANRAVAVTSGASVVSHVYDATGCRVAKTESGVTRYYALDYSDPFKRPLAELTDAGALVRRYIWAGSLLLAMVESNGVVRYVHSDGQGSVIALTDASGNVTDQWAWGPYGEPWGRIGTNDLSFTWLGGSGVRSLGNGLYATYHRLYDANLRRFLQADPLGIEGGANVYAYGNLNPMVFVDPLGLYPTIWPANGDTSLGSVLEHWRAQENASAARAWENDQHRSAFYDAVVVKVETAIAVASVVRAAPAVLRAFAPSRAVSLERTAVTMEQVIADAPQRGTFLSGAANTAPGRIVVGENMDRVRTAAQRLGAERFEGTGMEANRAWVQMTRAQGYEVYDIGPDFTRRAQRVGQGIRPDSPFYNMERMEMRGYENYFRRFERTGRYTGGAPGID
jgi:RHS repeat-associated protein